MSCVQEIPYLEGIVEVYNPALSYSIDLLDIYYLLEYIVIWDNTIFLL